MEPQTDVNQEGATDSPSSSEVDHPLTVQTIRDALMPLIDERFGAHVGNLSTAYFRGLQSMLDSKISQIQEQFGVSRETALAMQATAKQTLGDDAYAEISERAKREALEARLAAMEAGRTQQPAQETRVTVAQRDWAVTHEPELKEFCEEIDIPMADVMTKMGKKTIWDFPDEWVGWKREFRKRGNTMAAERDKAAESRKTVIDSTRSAAAGKKDYSNVPIRDIPDAEFTSNFNDIVAATVAKNRR